MLLSLNLFFFSFSSLQKTNDRFSFKTHSFLIHKTHNFVFGSFIFGFAEAFLSKESIETLNDRVKSQGRVLNFFLFRMLLFLSKRCLIEYHIFFLWLMVAVDSINSPVPLPLIFSFLFTSLSLSLFTITLLFVFHCFTF